MLRDRITIGISGVSRDQYEEGFETFVEEFTHRPWLLNPQVLWDETNNKIIAIIDRVREDEDHEGQGTLDEVWDNVFISFEFTEPLRVEILKAEHLFVDD